MNLLDIDANTTLADITIPGTHDTGTWNGNSNDRCQSMNFQQQLEWGIRWFDLRLVVNLEDMEIYHAGDRQNVYLARDILPVLKQFLIDNPTETVVLCVHHEFGLAGHCNDTPNPRGRDFDGLLHDLLMRGVTTNKLYDQPAMPKLARLGGCIVLMRRDKGATFGIRQLDQWPGDSTGTFTSGIGNVKFSVQDAYGYASDYLTAKWRNVRDQLQAAANRKDGAAWYINFTSASRAPLTTPVEIAVAEPDLQGVNYQFHGYLCSQVSPVHLGTIPMDFPESPYGLVKLLISMNKLRGV
jgi:hypothetical protein